MLKHTQQMIYLVADKARKNIAVVIGNPDSTDDDPIATAKSSVLGSADDVRIIHQTVFTNKPGVIMASSMIIEPKEELTLEQEVGSGE